MKVAVTGGTGFMGRPLVAALLGEKAGIPLGGNLHAQ